MKAFWVPQKAPDARINLEKPDSSTFCPASGKKLKLKDLIPVKFAPVPEGESGVHMDPITKDNFTNASALVVLKPKGMPCQCFPGQTARTGAFQCNRLSVRADLNVHALSQNLSLWRVSPEPIS